MDGPQYRMWKGKSDLSNFAKKEDDTVNIMKLDGIFSGEIKGLPPQQYEGKNHV